MFCMLWSCCCTGHAGWVQGWCGWGQMAARHSRVPRRWVRTCTCARHCTRPATAGTPTKPQANETTLWVGLDNAYEDPNTEFRVNQVSQVIIMTSPVTGWPLTHTQPGRARQGDPSGLIRSANPDYMDLSNAHEDQPAKSHSKILSQALPGHQTDHVTARARTHTSHRPLHIRHTCRQHTNQQPHTAGRGVRTTVLHCTAHWGACTAC